MTRLRLLSEHLSCPPYSAEPGVALLVLVRAPREMVLDFMADLVGVVLAGSHEEEVRAHLDAVGVEKSGPALLCSVESCLRRSR
jgi:hypothetical protein